MTAKGGLREQVRAAFTENIGIKLLSLLCALVLYAFLHGPENAQRTFSVSVVSLIPPDSANRMLVTQLPTEVGIILRGSRAQLDELHADDLGNLRLDLRSGRLTTIELDSSMFHVPTGITVEQIIPSSIKVRWDDVISRSIQIQVARTGEPAPGFAVKGGITVEPSNVQARGPRSIVEVMQFARAAPFDVTGLTEGVQRRQLLLDKPPSLVTYDAESVFASVEITRELVKKEFTKLKVEVIGAPRATTVPATVKVTVTGTAEDLNGITPESLVPRVEPKAAGNDTNKPGSDVLPVLVDVGKAKAEVDPTKVVVKW
jgi:hypothetical protein